MSDLISRREVIELLHLYHIDNIAVNGKRIAKLVKELPSVEPVRGKWISDKIGIYFCSKCDSEAYWDTDYGQQLFDFCPNCGADMRGEKNEKGK